MEGALNPRSRWDRLNIKTYIKYRKISEITVISPHTSWGANVF